MALSREALFQYLDLRYKRERMPATVVGAANGVVTIQIDGETQTMQHHGVEALTPGSRIWVRETGAKNNALETYEFAGGRSQQGSTNENAPTGAFTVSEEAIAQYIDPLIERIQDLEDFIDALVAGHIIYDGGTAMPQRGKLVFQGSGVTVVDNAAEDKTVVTISGGGGGGGGDGSYNQPIGYNEPVGYNG